MDYTVIETNGTQYLVKPKDTLNLLGQLGEVGTNLKAKTLLTVSAEKVALGTPYLTSDTTMTITGLKPSPKIRVATYKAKSRYRKVKGHRQALTIVQVAAK
ncbi:50S ribosomal protein L21 [Microgenomates group bacterium RBG_16_45_19]|nr:MAG: 50S ribosomal protein L21 [Microgenomates group bacterium RBG_16_45_19]